MNKSDRWGVTMFFRKKKIVEYTIAVRGYINEVIEAERKNIAECQHTEFNSEVRYSERGQDSGVKFSHRVAVDDSYDVDAIKEIMSSYSENHSVVNTIRRLNNCVDKTFVDGVRNIIFVRGYKDSQVYKAACIDRRLFSKIMSNREYQPSKDTAIALAFALKLSTEQAKDLLSRAGYTLSHSSRRDIILEYFFEEKIYNLDDINEVLFNLNEKIIGR